MPVTSDIQSCVVATPARDRLYNTLDLEWKDFAVLLCNYFHEKNNEQDFVF